MPSLTGKIDYQEQQAEKLERAKDKEFGMAVHAKASKMNETVEAGLKTLTNKFAADMEKKGIEVASVAALPLSFDTISKDAEKKLENALIGTTFVLVISVAPADMPQCGVIAAHRADVTMHTIGNIIKG